jgi:hypothetical protein
MYRNLYKSKLSNSKKKKFSCKKHISIYPSDIRPIIGYNKFKSRKNIIHNVSYAENKLLYSTPIHIINKNISNKLDSSITNESKYLYFILKKPKSVYNIKRQLLKKSKNNPSLLNKSNNPSLLNKSNNPSLLDYIISFIVGLLQLIGGIMQLIICIILFIILFTVGMCVMFIITL